MPHLDDIIANKSTSITSADIYNKIYANQFIELTKNMMSFLLARLLYKLLTVSVFDTIGKDKVVTIIFIIVVFMFLMYIAVELFTYMKIKSDKDAYINALTNTT